MRRFATLHLLPPKGKQAWRTSILAAALIGTLLTGVPIRAQEGRALPAPLCALSNQRLVCYDQQTAAPHILSAPGQQVVDFAFAPDGNWLVYRADGILTIVSAADSGSAFVIDRQGPAPLSITPATVSLAWSPDGRAIAYATAFGLRVALPPDSPADAPHYLNDLSRPYDNLRFSADGHYLAAQGEDGQWVIFALDPNKVDGDAMRTVREIPQAGELAWLDDNSFIVAPQAGGLERLAAEGKNAPAWTLAQDHFTKLLSISNGQVVATHPDPGDTIGSVVSITPDGKVLPLGNSKIDSRAVWGPDGQVMLYIDSGTPILVDRGTGAEDMLPVRGVSRIAWAPPPTESATSLALDADLYFLAPDGEGRDQLWRLAGSGKETARPLSAEPYTVLDYAVRSDGQGAVLTSGGQLLAVTFDPAAPGDPTQDMILALLDDSGAVSQGGQPAWQPDGKGLIFRDRAGLYNVPFSKASSTQPGTPQAQPPKVAPFRKGSFFHPRFSPDGRTLLVEQLDPKATSGQPQPALIDLANGQMTALKTGSGERLQWAGSNALLAFSGNGASGNLRLIGAQSAASQGQVADRTVGDPAWRIADAHLHSDGSLSLLREVGWPAGPEVVQGYSAKLDASGTLNSLQMSAKSGVIADAVLSPGGGFAAGFEQTGTIDTLVILDMTTGTKVRIAGVQGASALAWWP
ncbi:MAG TPA: hypothetical protein VKQ72_03110 [Aggregatilineales bacterium]|nr:hypothetical protein [Aggregatilineales bacterium]